MSGYCTCGAKLPEDARFCHKCGKPQRDEPVFVEEALESVPPPALTPPAPQFPPIGFRNRAAIVAGLVSGFVAIVLLLVAGELGMPEAAILGVVAGLIAAGFLAVFIYQWRTGQKLSMINGAHLGWISGIFVFSFVALMLSAMAVALSNPDVVTALRQQWQGAAGRQIDIDQLIQMLHSPSVMLPGIVQAFLLFTVLPACGGALGAKFLDRRH